VLLFALALLWKILWSNGCPGITVWASAFFSISDGVVCSPVAQFTSRTIVSNSKESFNVVPYRDKKRVKDDLHITANTSCILMC